MSNPPPPKRLHPGAKYYRDLRRTAHLASRKPFEHLPIEVLDRIADHLLSPTTLCPTSPFETPYRSTRRALNTKFPFKEYRYGAIPGGVRDLLNLAATSRVFMDKLWGRVSGLGGYRVGPPPPDEKPGPALATGERDVDRKRIRLYPDPDDSDDDSDGLHAPLADDHGDDGDQGHTSSAPHQSPSRALTSVKFLSDALTDTASPSSFSKGNSSDGSVSLTNASSDLG